MDKVLIHEIWISIVQFTLKLHCGTFVSPQHVLMMCLCSPSIDHFLFLTSILPLSAPQTFLRISSIASSCCHYGLSPLFFNNFVETIIQKVYRCKQLEPTNTNTLGGLKVVIKKNKDTKR